MADVTFFDALAALSQQQLALIMHDEGKLDESEALKVFQSATEPTIVEANRGEAGSKTPIENLGTVYFKTNGGERK